MAVATGKTVSVKYQQKVHAKLETTFDVLNDTAGPLVAADAVDNTSFEAGIETPRNEDNSNTGSAGRPKTTTGRDDGSAKLSTDARPSGAAGTPPQEHLFLLALFGSYVNSPATSDTYNFDSSVVNCMSLVVNRGDFTEIHTGFILNTAKLEFDGDGNVNWEFDGKHATTLKAGTDALDGAITDVATNITLDDAKKFDVGTRITIESEIMLVTARPTITTLTVTRGYSGTSNVAHIDDTVVTGLKPVHALTGAKITRPNILTLDDGDGSVAIQIMKGTVNWDKQLKEFNDETNTNKMTGGVYGVKKITLEIEMRLYRNQLFILDSIKEDKTFSGTLVIGDTAGRTFTFTLNQMTGLKVPFEESDVEQIVTRTFEFFENAGDDEMDLVIT